MIDAADRPSVRAVLAGLARDPATHLLRRWNWKSAVLSSVVRASLFFAANLSAGVDAARAALVTELAFRGATAGFYGALTQALGAARPVWRGTVAALILLPLVAHALEAVVHWLRGTVRLTDSIAASLAFTLVSTAYHLFAMRRGALIVGEGSGSLRRDLARTPGLIAAFVVGIVAALLRNGRAVVLWARYRVARCRDTTPAAPVSASATSASMRTGRRSDPRSRSTPTPRARAR